MLSRNKGAAMNMTWVLLADEGRARILAVTEPKADLVEIEELTDAAANGHDADFRHDAYPRRGGGGDLRTGSDAIGASAENKLDHEADLFARRIAGRLAEAHSKGRFQRLRIAAVPRFLGRLRKALDPQVAKTLVDEIDKDLLQFNRREIAQRLGPAPLS
jgi:protein required for attachment to host cells